MDLLKQTNQTVRESVVQCASWDSKIKTIGWAGVSATNDYSSVLPNVLLSCNAVTFASLDHWRICYTYTFYLLWIYPKAIKCEYMPITA